MNRFVALAALLLLLLPSATRGAEGKHLFILSGQSNMAGEEYGGLFRKL
ncbi:MAG: hypothetical protein AAF517_04635 [Planctomycetota bacterium]